MLIKPVRKHLHPSVLHRDFHLELKMESEDEKTIEAMLLEAQALFEQGNYFASALLAKQVLSKADFDDKGSHARAAIYLGMIYDSQGDQQSAFNCYDAAYRLDPLNHRSHEALYSLFEERGDFERAQYHADTAARLRAFKVVDGGLEDEE